jgi:hypothetical protein
MDNGNGADHFRGFETYLIFVVVFHPPISSLAAIARVTSEKYGMYISWRWNAPDYHGRPIQHPNSEYKGMPTSA